MSYATLLEIRGSRQQLSDPEDPLNQRVEAYVRDFGVQDELALCLATVPIDELEGASEPSLDQRLEMKWILREVARRLAENEQWFPRAATEAEPVESGELAVFFTEPEDFEQVADLLDRLVPSLVEHAADPALDAVLARVTAALEEQIEGGGSSLEDAYESAVTLGVRLVSRTLQGVSERLQDIAAADSRHEEWLPDLTPAIRVGETDAEGFTFLDSGRIAVLPISVVGDAGAQNLHGRAVARARKVLAEVVAENGGGFQAGLVGLPALEAEEIEISQRDFGRGAVIALVLVSLLFIQAFRSLRRPILAALCLGLSIGITFLLAYLVIGYLNLIATVFAVVLVALGIDFAIHVTTHYERELEEERSPDQAVQGTLRQVGPALWLGGLTTAFAFFAVAMTKAPGLSELGLIAGIGLFTCLPVMLYVYPAMLLLIDRRRVKVGRPLVGRPASESGSTAPVRAESESVRVRKSLTSLAVCVVAVVMTVLGFTSGQTTFDTNLLAMQPSNGEAAQWLKTIARFDDRTQFARAVFEDRESLESARGSLESRPDLVRSTYSAIPRDEATRRRRLQPVASQLRGVSVSTAEVPELRSVRRSVFRLRSLLRRTAERNGQAREELQPLLDAVDRLFEVLNGLRDSKPVDVAARLESLQRAVEARLTDLVANLQVLVDPPEFDPGRIPRALRDRFLSDDGRFSMQIVPAFDTWGREGRERFVEGVREIEPQVFDGIVNLHHNSLQMIDASRRGALYALITVALVTMVGCRSVKRALLSIVPLLSAFGFLLLTMELWPIEWNFGNFFALSVLIGVGVDAGIHLTEAWVRSPAVYRCARRAVLLSGLTTWIGFFVLTLSDHLGVRSLGVVLSIGIGWLLVTSLLILPAALRLAHPRHDVCSGGVEA
ncbi:MAG: MMPL family transporter [Planctomycetota bacterium]